MFEIIKKGPGSYHFHLRTGDGNSLLQSIDFSSREEINGIVEQLHALMEDHMVFERQTNHRGKFLFLLKDAHGKPLGSSQLYNSEAGMENGIKNLRARIAMLRKQRES
jgi:uncharacterized protein YegP (UPF0339 family)